MVAFGMIAFEIFVVYFDLISFSYGDILYVRLPVPFVRSSEIQDWQVAGDARSFGSSETPWAHEYCNIAIGCISDLGKLRIWRE